MKKVDKLKPTKIQDFRISHLLELTMVDGKVATILSNQTPAAASVDGPQVK